MKPILLLTPLALALGAHAQSPDALMLQTYQTLPSPLPQVSDVTWKDGSFPVPRSHSLVAFKVPSAPAGSHTRLFVHVTLDPDQNPPFLVQALHEAYPFLLPEQTASHTVASMVGSTILLPGGAAQCDIPAQRVKNHLLKPTTDVAQFGPLASPGPQVLTWTRAVGLPENDERAPWPTPLATSSSPTWTNLTMPINSLVRNSIIMACQQAFATNSTVGAAALGDLLLNDYVYRVTIQGVQVKPSTGADREIKFTQTVRMTRVSLKWDNGDRWFLAHGPLRTLPDITHDPLRHFLVAKKGEEFHVELMPGEVVPTGTNVVALIPTATGWATMPKLVNHVSDYDHMLRFTCPDNAVNGFYYVGYQYPLPDGLSWGPIFPLQLKHAYEFVPDASQTGAQSNPFAVMVIAVQV